MPTFDELSSKLGSALKDLAAKKKVLDDCTIAIQKANNEYNAAVEGAQGIRQDMHDFMESLIPTPQGARIR